MLDIVSVNRSLGSLEGIVYQPAGTDEDGILYANDSLVCIVSDRSDHLYLRAPIVYPDELESEDFRSETGEDSGFYQEETGHLRYFLEANRYGGASRGQCVCFDPELEAVTLVCRVLYPALTENGLQQLIYSLFMIVLKQRLELFPDEVDQGVAQLVAGSQNPGSLSQLGNFLEGRV